MHRWADVNVDVIACRGPFLPAYWPKESHWSAVLTSRLNSLVKLVGPTISCEGRSSPGRSFLAYCALHDMFIKMTQPARNSLAYFSEAPACLDLAIETSDQDQEDISVGNWKLQEMQWITMKRQESRAGKSKSIQAQ